MVGPGDLIEWFPSEEGVELKFRKKVSLDEITDFVDTKKKPMLWNLKRKHNGDDYQIILDSSFFIALALKNDHWHLQAKN